MILSFWPERLKEWNCSLLKWINIQGRTSLVLVLVVGRTKLASVGGLGWRYSI